jgi:hypothetical protein
MNKPIAADTPAVAHGAGMIDRLIAFPTVAATQTSGSSSLLATISRISACARTWCMRVGP